MAEPSDLSPFDAPPIPKHLMSQVRRDTSVSAFDAPTMDLDAHEDLDPEDAPRVPALLLPTMSRAQAPHQAQNTEPVSLADVAELPPTRTQSIDVVPGLDDNSDNVLIAIGAAVAVTGLVLLVLVFQGY